MSFALPFSSVTDSLAIPIVLYAHGWQSLTLSDGQLRSNVSSHLVSSGMLCLSKVCCMVELP